MKNIITEGYQHTQIGYLSIISIGIPFLFTAYIFSTFGFHWIVFPVLLILGFCLVSFSTLTVGIKSDVLIVRFGPGIIKKKFLLKDILSCQVVKNHWYYGWGIRLTPHGWLYNVSGLSAVELKMRNGKKYRIGTDVPNELVKAMLQSI